MRVRSTNPQAGDVSPSLQPPGHEAPCRFPLPPQRGGPPQRPPSRTPRVGPKQPVSKRRAAFPVRTLPRTAPALPLSGSARGKVPCAAPSARLPKTRQAGGREDQRRRPDRRRTCRTARQKHEAKPGGTSRLSASRQAKKAAVRRPSRRGRSPPAGRWCPHLPWPATLPASGASSGEKRSNIQAIPFRRQNEVSYPMPGQSWR